MVYRFDFRVKIGFRKGAQAPTLTFFVGLEGARVFFCLRTSERPFVFYDNISELFRTYFRIFKHPKTLSNTWRHFRTIKSPARGAFTLCVYAKYAIPTSHVCTPCGLGAYGHGCSGDLSVRKCLWVFESVFGCLNVRKCVRTSSEMLS